MKIGLSVPVLGIKSQHFVDAPKLPARSSNAQCFAVNALMYELPWVRLSFVR